MSDLTTHVMLDLETLGTEPDARVLSIGAVKFTSEGIVTYSGGDIINCFECYIDDKGGSVTLDTFLWWLKQANAARIDQVEAKRLSGRALTEDLDAFVAWVGDCPVWGNGATFDLTIARWLLSRYGVKCWPPRQDRCYRTWRQDKPTLVWTEGTRHTALADAIAQAHHMVCCGGF